MKPYRESQTSKLCEDNYLYVMPATNSLIFPDIPYDDRLKLLVHSTLNDLIFSNCRTTLTELV